MVRMVENLPAVQDTQVQSLGWKDPLEKGMAKYSCQENPMDRGRIQPMGLQVTNTHMVVV